ncbi:MAG: nucleotide exchange factor GrpE [Synechococcus sp. ELA057]
MSGDTPLDSIQAPGSPEPVSAVEHAHDSPQAEASAADQPLEAAAADPFPPAGDAPEAGGSAAGEPSGDAEASDSERLQALENQLTALQAENESLRAQYMRIAADFDNFRKRQSRDQDDLKLQITCTTLSEILPVVDNFDRARQQLNPQSEEAQTLHRSYQGLYKQLVDVFKQLGVSPMRVEGEPFDPNLHEAVLREESQDHSEDVVIEELQRGYHLNGRVLRHALVKVSMGPGPGSAGDTVEQPG